MSDITDARSGHVPKLKSLARWMGVLALAIGLLAAPAARAAIAVPEGIWLIDAKVAVQIYDCGPRLCGRILWLIVPRDAQGVLDVDANNPIPALRSRKLCGMTIFWGMEPQGGNVWKGGHFYNPDDGNTYNINAELVSDDLIVARIFWEREFLSQTKQLRRVPRGTSDGWC